MRPPAATKKRSANDCKLLLPPTLYLAPLLTSPRTVRCVRAFGHDTLKAHPAGACVKVRAVIEVLAVDDTRHRRLGEELSQHPLSLDQRLTARLEPAKGQ